LQLTGWRLGAAAAFTHYLSNLHFPPPLRQTARYLLAFFDSLTDILSVLRQDFFFRLCDFDFFM
jgi:hypothetical protein